MKKKNNQPKKAPRKVAVKKKAAARKAVAKKKQLARKMARKAAAKKAARKQMLGMAGAVGGPAVKKKGLRKKVAVKKKIAAARKRGRNRLERLRGLDLAMPLPQLVKRLNNVAPAFLPEGGARDGRVTEEFTPRTVRHYQNMGIIDAPSRIGRVGQYGYRQLLQGLLVRRMLAEGWHARRISSLLSGCPDEKMERMLLRGLAVQVGPIGGPQKKGMGKKKGCGPMRGGRGPWTRVRVAPGLEVNISAGFSAPETPEERQAMMRRIGQAIREEAGRRG